MTDYTGIAIGAGGWTATGWMIYNLLKSVRLKRNGSATNGYKQIEMQATLLDHETRLARLEKFRRRIEREED